MALVGTIGIWPSVYRFPEGRTTFPELSAVTTSSGDRLYELSRPGSTVITMARVLLPKGEKEMVPGINSVRRGRMWYMARSVNSPNSRVLLSRTR